MLRADKQITASQNSHTTDRQTDKQMDGQTDKQMDGWTCRQTQRQVDGWTDKTDGQTRHLVMLCCKNDVRDGKDCVCRHGPHIVVPVAQAAVERRQHRFQRSCTHILCKQEIKDQGTRGQNQAAKFETKREVEIDQQMFRWFTPEAT